MCPILPTSGQNLVPNHSFESIESSECLTGEYHKGTALTSYSNFICVKHWEIASGLPDYVHLEYQEREDRHPQPHSGKAYVGIYIKGPGQQTEALTIELEGPFAKEAKYVVGMYVTKDLIHYPASVDGIGVYFSATPFNEIVEKYGVANRQKLIASLQPLILKDSTGRKLGTRNEWMYISGEYTALGGEKFLTIALPPTDVGIANQTIYYYIDDISVVPAFRH